MRFERPIHVARGVAVRIGPPHSVWDVIADAKAILAGGRSVLPRESVERMLLDITAAA